METSIVKAIEQLKEKENIAIHNSTKCFDFGEYVLVVYTQNNKYGVARPGAEIVMEELNRLADLGINTPRYYEIKRIKDINVNYCYILQDKAKGKICSEIRDLEEITSIPQEHYDKLAFDLCNLKHLGTEAHIGSNLFYDNESGFWIIDLEPEEKYYTTMTDEEELEQIINFTVANFLFFTYSQEQIKQLSEIEETKTQNAINNYLNNKPKTIYLKNIN